MHSGGNLYNAQTHMHMHEGRDIDRHICEDLNIFHRWQFVSLSDLHADRIAFLNSLLMHQF